MAEPDDPYDVTDFRFRIEDYHNRDMLEYQAERAFIGREWALAAVYAQAAGLYAISVKLTALLEGFNEMLEARETPDKEE